MKILKLTWIVFMLLGANVFAETPPCLVAYRKAFLDMNLHHPDSQRISDAKTIYLIYFDSINDFDVAYEEAEPIFNVLGTPQSDRDEVLHAIQWCMRTGDLCNSNNETKSMSEILELLQQKVPTKTGDYGNQ